jgi:hypothetical protein
MAFEDDAEFHATLLEEFGRFSAAGCEDGENVWLVQADGAREFERQRKWRAACAKKAAGECLDCNRRAVSGRQRCADHLALGVKKTLAYNARVAHAPIAHAPVSKTTRAVLARSAAARAQRRRQRA